MKDDEDDEYATNRDKEQDSMITQLGKIIDSDDVAKDAEAMKIKKFTPVTSVQTDDGQSVDVPLLKPYIKENDGHAIKC